MKTDDTLSDICELLKARNMMMYYDHNTAMIALSPMDTSKDGIMETQFTMIANGGARNAKNVPVIEHRFPVGGKSIKN